MKNKAFLLALLAMTSTLAMAQQKIVLAAEDDWYPFSGLHDGNYGGFSPELIRAAYATQGVEVEFKVVPFTRCMAMARTQTTLGCFDSVRGKDIENTYLWHQRPMFRSRLYLYARKESRFEYHSIKDLQNGPRVGVTVGYEYGDDFDRSKNIRRDVANTNLQGLQKLLRGRVDLVPVYDKVYRQLANANPEFDEHFKVVGTLFEADLYVAFSRQHPDSARYAALLDKGLLQLINSGEYQKIEMRWK
ncbi:MAG: hypothetical protein RL210_1272 [Pseudomonadota bacterium]|mgnify:FL=1|jgi:polar amino acid transport system substrate-binding protein